MPLPIILIIIGSMACGMVIDSHSKEIVSVVMPSNAMPSNNNSKE